MGIPAFDPVTGYLPPGLHDATIDEVSEAFGFSAGRRELLANLEWIARALFAAGVEDLRIDGSFVTDKPEPADIDGFWVDGPGVRWNEIPRPLKDFRAIPDPASDELKFPMWFRWRVELYVHPHHGTFAPGDFPHYFSHSRDGVPRGYVRVVPG